MYCPLILLKHIGSDKETELLFSHNTAYYVILKVE